MMAPDVCNCPHCDGMPEQACDGDCDIESDCPHCKEAREAAKDREHDEMVALGYK